MKPGVFLGFQLLVFAVEAFQRIKPISPRWPWNMNCINSFILLSLHKLFRSNQLLRKANATISLALIAVLSTSWNLLNEILEAYVEMMTIFKLRFSVPVPHGLPAGDKLDHLHKAGKVLHAIHVRTGRGSNGGQFLYAVDVLADCHYVDLNSHEFQL